MSKYIQGRDGQFAGSIGDGKHNVPTASSAVLLDRTIMRAAVDAAFASNGEASFDDVYAAYQAEKASRDAAAARGRADEEAKAAALAARAVFWSEFQAVPGAVVPADYDSSEHLPVGTIVRMEGSSRAGGFWDGHRWIKTGKATWAVVNGRGGETLLSDARAALDAATSNVTPCPADETGLWVIEGVLN